MNCSKRACTAAVVASDVGVAVAAARDLDRLDAHDEMRAVPTHDRRGVKRNASDAGDEGRKGVGPRRAAEERHFDAATFAQVGDKGGVAAGARELDQRSRSRRRLSNRPPG